MASTTVGHQIRNQASKEFGCKHFRDKIGILVAQLGTPQAPTKEALRPYLKQFLSDPRVIEKNRILWWTILNLFILPFRPKRSAALYARIWKKEGSPLLLYTRALTEKLGERLKEQEENIETVFGMRYGSPSLESALDTLIEKGCSKILLLPLYPQYSATTSASTYDAVFPHLLKRRFVPTLRVAEPYYADKRYVQSLAQSINEFYASAEIRPERLVLSYHGIPEEYVNKGDPYCCQCVETTAALLPLLDIPRNEVIHTFQSRFGRDPWLQPYSDETIQMLGKKGVKNIAVVCPGFTCDCLETLDEMGNEAREEFQEAGGETLQLIPCLNDARYWVDGLRDIVLGEVSSWIESARERETGHITCPIRRLKESSLDAVVEASFNPSGTPSNKAIGVADASATHETASNAFNRAAHGETSRGA